MGEREDTFCNYRKGQPQLDDCLNVIHDAMPLPGWWPWPREKETAGSREQNWRGKVRGTRALWEGKRLVPAALTPELTIVKEGRPAC